MSEIASVLSFLGDVVYFLFDQSLNLIATGMLVASAIFPWRWGEIYFTLRKDWDSWKGKCFESFFLTLVDCIAVPCLFFGLLSPFRWIRVAKVIGNYLACESQSFDNYLEYRGSAILLFVLVIADFFTIPFVLLTLLSPFGRQFGLLTYFMTNHNCRNYNYDDDDDSVFALNSIFVWYGIDGAIDLVSFLFLPLVVMVPTTWPSMCRIFALIWEDAPTILESPSQVPKSSYCESISDFHTAIRVWLLEHCILAVCDMTAAIPFVFAFLSPLRHTELMRLVWPPATPPRAMDTTTTATTAASNLEAGEDMVISDPLPAPERLPGVITQFAPTVHHAYDLKEPDYLLRVRIIKLGLLAMADLLLYPMILVLWLTRYRYHCIEHLMTAENHWAVPELISISKQFCFLQIDLFFALPLIFVFLTRLRWPAVYRALSRDETLKSKNCEFYALILKQIFFFVMDILTLPFLAIVLLSVYRFLPLIPVLTHPDAFVEGLTLNATIFVNALVVLHDVIFVLPSLTLIIVLMGFSRLHTLCYCYEASCQENRATLQDRRQRRQHFQAIDNQRNAARNEATVAPRVSLDDTIEDSNCDLDLRLEVWEALFSTMLDLPFLIMGVIVILTLWRSSCLIRDINQIFKAHPMTGLSSRGKANSMKERLNSCRGASAAEFGALLADIVVIIPMTFVLGSVYRAPGLIVDLLALVFEASAVFGVPLFNISRVEISWKTSTEPVISMEVTPLRGPHSDSHPQWIHDFTRAEYFQLSLVGDEIWDQSAHHLGGMITSVVKSLLPLKLRLSKDEIGLIRRSNGPSTTVPTIGASLEPPTMSRDHSLDHETLHVPLKTAAHSSSTSTSTHSNITVDAISDIWIKLPLKDVKRSTVIKKLRLFNPTTTLTFQVCGKITALQYVTQREGYVAQEDPAMIPLVYVSCTVQQLIQALTSTSSTVTAEGTAAAASAPDETVLLTAERMDMTDYERLDTTARRVAESNDKADRYSAIVLRHFVLLVMDIMYLCLFVFLLLSPWRMVQCLYRIFSNDHQLYDVLGKDVQRNLVESEFHLKQLRDMLLPILNHFAKDQNETVNDYRSDWAYWESPEMKALERKKKYEIRFHLERYAQLTKIINYQVKTMQKLSLTNSEFENKKMIDVQTMDNLWQLHNRLFYWLFARYSLWGVQSRSLGESHANHAKERHDKYILSSLVIVEEHDHVVDEMLRARRAIEQSLHVSSASSLDETPTKKKPSFWKQCRNGCRIHPAYQVVIRRMARRVVSDWAGLWFFVVLLGTMVEFVPFLASMYWKERPVSPKSVMLFHIRRLEYTLLHLGRLFVCLTLLTISVVGLPHYIDRMRSELRADTTLEDLADIASQELRLVFDYLWELFCLFTVFKTYRILLKCVLYCLLLPGAVIADALGTIMGASEHTMSLRFTLGSLVFGGIFAGAVVVANRTSIAESATLSNNSLLALLLVVVAVQVIVGILAHYHPASQLRYALSRRHHANATGLKARATMLRLQWDHVMGVLLAPIECLCLSSVILFFYWQAPGYNMAAQRHFHTWDFATMLGVDNLSKLLFWNAVDEVAGTSAMKTEVSLACFATVIWAAVISIPLVQGGEDRYRFAKIVAVLRHKTYKAVVFWFGQVLGVWILATLMRPNSCVVLSSGAVVMSTQLTHQCGTNSHYDLGHAALVFGVYFLITSAIVHPRFYEPPSETLREDVRSASLSQVRYNRYRYTANEEKKETSTTLIFDVSQEATFHPSYNLFVRTVQTLICTLCFSLVGVTPSVSVLVSIFALCVLVAFVPWIVTYLTPRDTNCDGQDTNDDGEAMSDLSTVSSLVTCRSAAYLAIAWTTLVCIVRVSVRANDTVETTNRLAQLTIFATEGTVYIGWAVIALVTVVIVYRAERQKLREWQELLDASGVTPALESMAKLYQLVSNEFYGHHIRRKLGSGSNSGHIQTVSSSTTAANAAVEDATQQKEDEEAARWSRVVRYAMGGSLPGLVRLVAELEELVPIDRLSREYLYVRQRWVSCLASLLTSDGNVFDKDFVVSEDARQVELNYVNNEVTSNDDLWATMVQRARQFHDIAPIVVPASSATTPTAAVAGGSVSHDTAAAAAAPLAPTSVTPQADVSGLTRDQLLDFFGTDDPVAAANIATALEANLPVSSTSPSSGNTTLDTYNYRSTNVNNNVNNNNDNINNDNAETQLALPQDRASVMTRRLHSLRVLIAMVHQACHDSFTTTYVSRHVLATMLSYRRVPREVSWIVFSYMVDLSHLRNILVHHMTHADSLTRLHRLHQVKRLPQGVTNSSSVVQQQEAQDAELVVLQNENKRLEEARRQEKLVHPLGDRASRKRFCRDNVGSTMTHLRPDMATVFKLSLDELSGGRQLVYR